MPSTWIRGKQGWKQDIPVCRILKKKDLPYKSLGASDMAEGKKFGFRKKLFDKHERTCYKD